MTYYAVTNDPNELMHFGIKGMKWGVIRSPEQLGHHKSTKSRSSKPRSPAYLKASAKLSRAMQAGIARAQANWKVYNSPAQKALRAENRAINKQIRDYKRNEKAFQKHLELARQGRLKYKGISDEEVGRITDRLALERSSRLLSGTEKQSFGRRLRERIGEGVIEGAGRGVSGYISERMTGRGRTTAEIIANRRKRPQQLKFEKEDYKRKQQRAEEEAKKAEREAAEENYKAAVEANRQLSYDNVLGIDSAARQRLQGYSVERRNMKKLSVAELKGRTTALNDVKKLYGDDSSAAIKAAYGGKKTTRTDPITGEKIEEETYDGKSRSESKPEKSSKQKASDQLPESYAVSSPSYRVLTGKGESQRPIATYLVNRMRNGSDNLESGYKRMDANRSRLNYNTNMQKAIALQDIGSEEAHSAVKRQYQGRHTYGHTVTRVRSPHIVSNTLNDKSQFSPSSSVTVTPHPMSSDRTKRRNQSRPRNIR